MTNRDNVGCLYALFDAEKEHHDTLVRAVVRPLAEKVRDDDALHTLFFVRFNVPHWHLRVRVLGDETWLDDEVRPLFEQLASESAARDDVRGVEWPEYEPEYERYGGPRGVHLAERIFLADSMACLDLMDAEEAGEGPTSRREFHMLMTECVLDLCGFDRAQRVAFHESCFRWAVESGSWEPDHVELLEERFASLSDGIGRLMLVDPLDPGTVRESAIATAADGTSDAAAFAAARWGSPRAAAIARAQVAEMQPWIAAAREECGNGTLSVGLSHLARSWTHLACNRLGIEPAGEAILRFLMHRWWRDAAPGDTLPERDATPGDTVPERGASPGDKAAERDAT